MEQLKCFETPNLAPVLTILNNFTNHTLYLNLDKGASREDSGGTRVYKQGKESEKAVRIKEKSWV